MQNDPKIRLTSHPVKIPVIGAPALSTLAGLRRYLTGAVLSSLRAAVISWLIARGTAHRRCHVWHECCVARGLKAAVFQVHEQIQPRPVLQT
jgi:hypothetical protein